jgi:hypothetical protein
MSDAEQKLLAAAIAAVATLAVGVLGALVAYSNARRERRRLLYSEATKAAVGWVELLYRVRRRGSAKEDAAAIVDQFHTLQDQLTYYQGWVASESKYMARSYRRFVCRVKERLEPLIQDAWSKPGRAPFDITPADEEHPDIQPWADEFLRDVRAQLSWQPWRKMAMASRNKAA